MQTSLYELLNQDVPVLRFSYSAEIHQPISVEALLNPEFAPPILFDRDGTITVGNLAYWWGTRSIPSSRDRFAQLMQDLRLDSASELAERCLGLSLSDRYWVRPCGSGLTWGEVNFFDNDFSQDLGYLTLEGDSPTGPIDLRSPSSSVIGDLKKKWVIENGKRYLVKGGSSLFAQEPVNEVAATALYRRVLPDDAFVPYELVESGGSLYSRCPEMLSGSEELVSAWDLLYRFRADRDVATLPRLLTVLRGIGFENARDDLSRIFITDALIANPDRHFRNFGVIRDAHTLEYARIAPIFDSGAGLWCRSRNLESPVDFDYEARPFTAHDGKPMDAETQVHLFDDCPWLDLGMLPAWRDEALEILARDALLTPERIERIGIGIDRQIRIVRNHVERMRC